MAMSDINTSIDEYARMSDVALCALNPKDCFAEIGPSIAPIVLSVAGAALIAI
jgi:hypothetical protein